MQYGCWEPRKYSKSPHGFTHGGSKQGSIDGSCIGVNTGSFDGVLLAGGRDSVRVIIGIGIEMSSED